MLPMEKGTGWPQEADGWVRSSRVEKMAMSVRSRIQRGLVLACVVLGVVSTAWGDLVSVQLTGVVDYSDFGTIGVGSPVTGSYSYDDTMVPYVAPPGTLAWYLATPGKPITVSVAFADGSSIGTDDGMIMVHNNTVSGTDIWDIYAVGFDLDYGEGTRTGAFTDHRVNGWVVARADPTGTAWDSLALPDPEIVLARLPNDESVLLFYDAEGYLKPIDLHITDLSVVPVPLPGALLLGALGLSAAGCLTRRRLG